MLSEPDNDARPRNYPSHARLRRVRFLRFRDTKRQRRVYSETKWCLVWKPRQLNTSPHQAGGAER